jgi:hypothetical protein
MRLERLITLHTHGFDVSWTDSVLSDTSHLHWFGLLSLSCDSVDDELGVTTHASDE